MKELIMKELKNENGYFNLRNMLISLHLSDNS